MNLILGLALKHSVVLGDPARAVNLAAQMARLPEHEGLEALAGGKTARLLKIGLSE